MAFQILSLCTWNPPVRTTQESSFYLLPQIPLCLHAIASSGPSSQRFEGSCRRDMFLMRCILLR